ncbi:MAG: hypothetical protein ACYCOO_01245 [Chitinophagaceae bacterium]
MNIFTHTSWLSFLQVITCLVLGYYLLVGLLFFRTACWKMIQRWIRIRPEPGVWEKFPHRPTQQEEQKGKVSLQLSREGSPGTPLGQPSIGNQNPAYTQTGTTSLPAMDMLLLGSIAGLLQEIRTLVRILEEGKANLEEFRHYFQQLLETGSQVQGTPYQEAISLFIYICTQESLQLRPSLEEIRTLWPQATSSVSA